MLALTVKYYTVEFSYGFTQVNLSPNLGLIPVCGLKSETQILGFVYPLKDNDSTYDSNKELKNKTVNAEKF